MSKEIGYSEQIWVKCRKCGSTYVPNMRSRRRWECSFCKAKNPNLRRHYNSVGVVFIIGLVATVMLILANVVRAGLTLDIMLGLLYLVPLYSTVMLIYSSNTPWADAVTKTLIWVTFVWCAASNILFVMVVFKPLVVSVAPVYAVIFIYLFWLDTQAYKCTGLENTILRTIVGILFIGIITFSVVSISQDLFKNIRLDLTQQKLYSLSNGTKAILARLNQPVKMKLYYTRTAALKGPDQIRFFNNYASYVESLLNEYVAASNGMVKLEVIDPRPFTDEEADAMRYGLRRVPMGQDESFIFGLVVQTQFGITKTIPLFSPDRQSFVEYDISYLIDTATRRQKKNIGVLSSLPVMGRPDDYMARMQGLRPPGPWHIIEQLQTKYNVSQIETNTDKIENVDILLLIHPKDLEEKTLFAIDQFLLNGGGLIVFIDPYCLTDQPQMGMMQADQNSSSNLKQLMKNWGLEMPDMTFAGDRKLALLAAPNQIPEKIIGFLGLTKADECFNKDSVITAQLNQVRVIFAGALQETALPQDPNVQIQRTPLMYTTSQGNTWTVDNPYELLALNPSRLMDNFFDGAEPVNMAYLLSGRFPSAFPNGIKIKNESDPNTEPNLVTGLTVSKEPSQIVIFSDVDFITDQMAYDETFFGTIVVGDNANIVLNAIDSLGGSADLIAVRSRGEVARGFEVVDSIETEAEKSVQQQENAINAEIAAYRQELEKILRSAQQGQEEVVGSSILQKRAELEVKIRQAEKRLREVRRNAYQGIESLGNRLRKLNTLPGPILILLLAVILGIYRSTKKKHYVSHKSDA